MKISVLGAGSFGTCLAILMGNKGYAVKLWARDPELSKVMEKTRENPRYLPGHGLPESVEVTSKLTEVLPADVLFAVTPSSGIADSLRPLVGSLRDTIVVNASKGIDVETLETIDETYKRLLPAEVFQKAVYFSGPTFAKEIAAGKPSAAVVAGQDENTVQLVQSLLSSAVFRAYSCADVKGVLIGGALKNVVAIAAGICDGLKLGANARAAIVTRGLAEISRVGVAMGADPLTFAGLSGLGDLVLTCSGDLSRNRRVGLGLGQGQALTDIQAKLGMVAEGVRTTKAADRLAKQLDVDAPITGAVYDVLFNNVSPSDALIALMGRELGPE